MDSEKFLSLKIGDVVWDRLKQRDMEVIKVCQPSKYDAGSVRFRWTETCTIFVPHSDDLVKFEPISYPVQS